MVQTRNTKAAAGLEVLDRCVRGLETIFIAAAVTSLAAIMGLTCIDAGGRYLFNHPLQGAYFLTEEYLMVFLVFLSLAFVQRTGHNINVTLVSQRFSPRLSHFWAVVCNGISLAVFAIAAWLCGHETYVNIVNRSFRLEVIDWPMFVPWLAATLGLALLTVRLALQVTQSLGHVWTGSPLSRG